MAIVKSCYKFG